MLLPMVEGDQSRAADSLLSHVQSSEHHSHPAAHRHPTESPQTQSAPAAGPSPRQGQGRMRSSIACTHCRRSKVKCVNNGVGTPCDACVKGIRECTYPSQPTGSTGPRRRDSTSGRPEATGDTERKRKQPRVANSHTFAAQAPAAATMRGTDGANNILDEALDLTLLTADVWLALHDIFERHYSADFPFVHAVTFRKPLDNAKQKQQSLRVEELVRVKPDFSDLWLLAFLALTARFHPKLVSHHRNEARRWPRDASEYYASVATTLLEPVSDVREDLDTVQAYLMLGMHAFGMCQGLKAWKIVGAAVRSAQAMGLQYAPESDHEGETTLVAKDDSEAFLEEEIRRRTFWSCFIMDRYTSNGTRRPQILHTRDITATLPASECNFAFKSRVETLPLGRALDPAPSANGSVARRADDSGRFPLETGQQEGCVSRYIQAMDFYHKVVRWSCGKGRRSEKYPPWDERCKFYQLREEAKAFDRDHPYMQRMNTQNTQHHIHSRSATPYMLTHIVYLLSQIFMHREYVPFLPLSCKKPEGPLDEPMFPPDKYVVPEHFWEESADACFKAARQIIDLANTCQFHGHGVETPIVGFAIYIVTFVGHYCILFPNMDPEGHMCTSKAQRKQDQDGKATSKGVEAATKANHLLGAMRPKLVLADGWSKTCKQVAKFMKNAKVRYERDGGVMHLGGGLEDYETFEQKLTDIGSLDDTEFSDGSTRSSKGSPESTPEMAKVKTEANGSRPRLSSGPEQHRTENTSGSWMAINAPLSRPPSMSVATHPSLFRSYESVSQSHDTARAASEYGSYRAPYSADTPNSANRPSLLSPSAPTQPSTPFERPTSYSSSSSWTQQLPNHAPGMPPPPPSHPTLTFSGTISSISPAPYSNPLHTNALAPPEQQQQTSAQTKVLLQENWEYASSLSLAAEDLEIFVDGSDPTAPPVNGRQTHPQGWLETAQFYGNVCIR